VDDDQHKVIRHGPAVMFALLLSLLLGAGPAGAFSSVHPAGFKPVETGKSAALARSIRRASDEQPAPADRPLEPAGAAPASDTPLRPHLRPATGASRPALAPAGDRPTPFHARAPPAA
jgi:hypothetical protein